MFSSVFLARESLWAPSYLLLGWMLAPLTLFAERYLFNDWQFAASLAVVVACDTSLGLLLAWQRKQVSSHGFARLFNKLVVYFFLLISTHTVATFRIQGEVNDLLRWADSLVYSAIMAREFLSLLEKTAALGIFQPPRWLLRRLALFDDDGRPVG